MTGEDTAKEASATVVVETGPPAVALTDVGPVEITCPATARAASSRRSSRSGSAG